MENTIEESLMRTYQPLYNMTSQEMIREITNGVDIRKRIVTDLKKCGSTIIMKYFPAMTISALDLMAVVDDVIEEYGHEAIAGLYVDYLDLLKSFTAYFKCGMYRCCRGPRAISLVVLDRRDYILRHAILSTFNCKAT